MCFQLRTLHCHECLTNSFTKALITMSNVIERKRDEGSLDRLKPILSFSFLFTTHILKEKGALKAAVLFCFFMFSCFPAHLLIFVDTARNLPLPHIVVTSTEICFEISFDLSEAKHMLQIISNYAWWFVRGAGGGVSNSWHQCTTCWLLFFLFKLSYIVYIKVCMEQLIFPVCLLHTVWPEVHDVEMFFYSPFHFTVQHI